jgi:hypothetical protein
VGVRATDQKSGTPHEQGIPQGLKARYFFGHLRTACEGRT